MDRSIVVLHVDDDPAVANLAKEYLEVIDDRFEIHLEDGPNAGLDRLAEIDVDCVISDFEMPGMNGIEFLETVRETYEDLPFILFTGEGSERVASDAIAAGATDYLQKGGTEQFELLANRVENAVEQHRAELQRRQNERRFEAVFEDPKLLVALLDTDGRLMQANHTAMEFVDVDHEAVVGEYFWETPWWSESVRDDVRQWIERAATGEYIEYEEDRLHREGRPRSAHGNVRPVTDDDGEVVSLIVSARDTTRRLESERRFEAVFEATSRCMALTDPDGTLLAVNESGRSAAGLDADALPDGPLWTLPPFDADDGTAGTVRDAVADAAEGREVEVDLTPGDADGSIAFSLTPTTDDDGVIDLLVAEWTAE